MWTQKFGNLRGLAFTAGLFALALIAGVLAPRVAPSDTTVPEASYSAEFDAAAANSTLADPCFSYGRFECCLKLDANAQDIGECGGDADVCEEEVDAAAPCFRRGVFECCLTKKQALGPVFEQESGHGCMPANSNR